jgi:serine/threonine-protein kinase
MGVHPSKIGKYDVTEIIGRGGMGVVYKATDPQIGRFVAIKMITGGFAGNPDLLKRFYREAQSTGSLQSPNIVTVYDLGDQDGNPYLVMEYLEGVSLESIISSRRPLSLSTKLGIIIDVCHGLSYAHQRGVIHRDIKPANIMVSNDGTAKIVDFGIAHIGDKGMTRTGQIVGSLSFMSPEQIQSKPVDSRSDIFSTGVVLYQLITNSLPFEGESTGATLMKIIQEPPPPIKNFVSIYPPQLESVILRALAKDREERYASADDFALDLNGLREQVKKEEVTHHLQEVRSLFAKGELFKARDQVVQVLKIERQNTEANNILRELQQRLRGVELMQQVQKLCFQAEAAFAQEQFESALADLDLALKIDKNNIECIELRKKVAAAHDRAQKLQQALQSAEAAHLQGQLDVAKQAVEAALVMAPNDTHARALQRAISRDWNERLRQVQVDELLRDAQKLMHLGKFSEAVEILQKAQTLDPAAPQTRALMDALLAKREVDRIGKEIEEALNRDDYVNAGSRATEALRRFPEDRTLSRLKALADKERDLAARRQFIEEQLAAAGKLLDAKRDEELITLLESALAKVGNEPRLQSLLSIVRANTKRSQPEGEPSSGPADAPHEPTLHYASATQLFSEPRAKTPSSRGQASAAGPISQTRLDARFVMSDAETADQTRTARSPRRVPLFIGAGALALIATVGIGWKLTHHSSPAASVAVEITTVPQGASVRIKGTNQECITPNCDLHLTPGQYQVEARLNGYEDLNRTITANSPGPNSVVMSLSEVSPPPTPNTAQTPEEKSLPASEQATASAVKEIPGRLQINGGVVGSEVFVDGKAIGKLGKNGSFSAPVLPGEHKVKMLSGNRESPSLVEHVGAGTTLTIRANDFVPPPPAQPAEQTDWQQVKDSQNVDQLTQFLQRYPNGAFRMQAEDKLDDLYWNKDRATDSPTALRDYLRRYPGGKHSQAATTELAGLDWRAIADTKDASVLENYLRMYPAGDYHDKASSKLDDLLWDHTGRGEDTGTLRAYLQTFPTGKHADQVRKELDQLTRPKETASTIQPHATDAPRPTTLPVTNASPVDDKSAVQGILTSYEKYYEGEDLTGLQQLWPTMSNQTVQGLADFFKNATSVKLTYIVVDAPQVAGNGATITFKQEVSYVMGGKFAKTKVAKVTMKLKKANAQGLWLIDSIH